MRKYIVGILLGVLILFPNDTKALMCGNEVKVKYSDMAKNISVNYEYVEANDDVTFSIKFSNIPEGFIIYDIKNEIDYHYRGSELVIPNVSKNTSYKFGIYIDDTSCEYSLLYTHYITIPSYNKYYKDDLCKGIENYKLCDKWINLNMTYDEWKDNVNKYIKSLIVDEDDDKKTEEVNVFDYIVDFYLEYYYYILPGIVVVCLVTIYIYNRKRDLF